MRMRMRKKKFIRIKFDRNKLIDFVSLLLSNLKKNVKHLKDTPYKEKVSLPLTDSDDTILYRS